MTLLKRCRVMLLMVGVLLALTACGGAGEPSMIAAEPREGMPPVPNAPLNEVEVIQTIWLELQVADLRVAVNQASGLAGEYGGAQQDYRAWTEGAESHVMLIFSIPTRQVEGARRAFLGLGEVLDESISNRVVAVAPGAGGESFSTITLMLHSSAPALPPSLPPLPEVSPSRPVQTFRAAFGVFSSLALLILDIVIWLVVVVAPFALVGYIIYSLMRRYEFRDGRLARREMPLATPAEPRAIAPSADASE